MKFFIFVVGLIVVVIVFFVEVEVYKFDLFYSQIVFLYNYFGFLIIYGMFLGFEGDIQFD